MNDTHTSFAKGDFSSWSNSFTQAGFIVQEPCAGVMQINAAESKPKRMRLLISVGVHGDETAPIEMMANLLERLSKSSASLAVDLMIVVGNLDAVAQSKRFIDADLNRLFSSKRKPQFDAAQEAQRADQLMQVTTQFFAGYRNKLHLDLHTAIRPSVYPIFAIVPGKNNPAGNPAFISWLGAAGIAAVVLSPQPSATYSSFTCAQLGVVSCTAELGRVGELGKNDLSLFAATENAIDALLRSGTMSQEQQLGPQIFCVVQELIKHSDAFQFAFDKNTKNFTEFSSKTVLATDEKVTYLVGETPEYVLFPNPDVHLGLRAALMVVRVF